MSLFEDFPEELGQIFERGTLRSIVEHFRDADTIELLTEGPFGVRVSVAVRVIGINSPEVHTREGKEALEAAKEIMPEGSYCLLDTRFRQSFARWLGTLTLPNGSDYGETLVKSGHAERVQY